VPGQPSHVPAAAFARDVDALADTTRVQKA
jgi:hypothetical protein